MFSGSLMAQSMQEIEELTSQKNYEEAEYIFEDLYGEQFGNRKFVAGYIDNLLQQSKIVEAQELYREWIWEKDIDYDEKMNSIISDFIWENEEFDRLEDQDLKVKIDVMPRFPGRENLDGSEMQKKKCAEEKMIHYIYTNLKYPKEARSAGIEGTVVVQFIVDRYGMIRNPKLVKDIGEGCGEEGLIVVDSMNDMGPFWTPGKQNGRAVSVYYTLPIRFRLGG